MADNTKAQKQSNFLGVAEAPSCGYIRYTQPTKRCYTIYTITQGTQKLSEDNRDH